MATTKTQRIVTLVLALVFAGSTVGIVALYVMANKQQNAEIESLSTAMSTTTSTQTLENFDPVAKIDSLQTVDLIVGTGAVVQAGDEVTVHYTGAIASTGQVFQSSYDFLEPVSFSLDGVIAGWSEGMPGMQVGGKRRLLIPASLAYGANPPSGSGIPVNADLVFDVELISIN